VNFAVSEFLIAETVSICQGCEDRLPDRVFIMAKNSRSRDFRTSMGTGVDTKVDISISRNTKFYAKLKFISQNFVPIISRNFAVFRINISRNFVKKHFVTFRKSIS
jgi:hypothetical protein